MCPVLSPTSFVARRRGGVSEQTHLYNQYGILSLRSGPLRSGRLGGFLLWCAILVLTRPANVALVFIVAIRLIMSSGKSMSSLCLHVSRPISVSVIWIPVIRIRTLVRQLDEDQQHQQCTLGHTSRAHTPASARQHDALYHKHYMDAHLRPTDDIGLLCSYLSCNIYIYIYVYIYI